MYYCVCKFFKNQLTLNNQFSLGERYPALTQAENVTTTLISIIDGGMSQVCYYYYLNCSLCTNHPSVQVMKLEIDITYN